MAVVEQIALGEVERPLRNGIRERVGRVLLIPSKTADGTPVPRPGWFERRGPIVLLLIAQGAFRGIGESRSLSPGHGGPGAESDLVGMLGTVIVALWLGYFLAFRFKWFKPVLAQNALTLAAAGWLIMTMVWSLDPGMTLRRGGVELIGVLLALYIATRFTLDEIAELTFWSIAISAFGSLAFAAALPDIGRMNAAPFSGEWRGVFAHKNSLGQVASLGAFCAIYVATGFCRRRVIVILFGLLCVGLTIMARSAASWINLALFIVDAVLFYLWRWRYVGPSVVLGGVAAAGFFLLLVISQDASWLFDLIGKDATLTGRTSLWGLVGDLIAERPWLGWGYKAVWQDDSNPAQWIWTQIGWDAPNSHNGIFEVALAGGVPAVLFTLALTLQTLHRNVQCWRLGAQREAWFGITIVICAAMTALTEVIYFEYPNITWVLCVMVNASAGKRVADMRRAAEPPAPPRIDPALERARPRAKHAPPHSTLS